MANCNHTEVPFGPHTVICTLCGEERVIGVYIKTDDYPVTKPKQSEIHISVTTHKCLQCGNEWTHSVLRFANDWGCELLPGELETKAGKVTTYSANGPHKHSICFNCIDLLNVKQWGT